MILIILLVAVVLRFINLNQSLWLDEGINVLAVKEYSLINLITIYSLADFHPPGYSILLWFWTRFFGFSEIAARTPSLIFGVLTVYIAYLIGNKIKSKKFGLIFAMLLAVNPLLIYYSQEARMYSFAAFAVSLSFLAFLKFLKQDKFSPLFYFFSLFLVLSSDYLAYFIVASQAVLAIFNKKLGILKNWFIVLFFALISWSWWVPFFIKQLSVGSEASTNIEGWRTVVGGIGFKPLALTYIKFIIGKISIDNNLIYGAVFLPIGLIFGYLIIKAIKEDFKISKLFLAWLLTPLLIGTVISFVIPVYSYFRLLFIVPAFLALVALGIYHHQKNLFKTFVTIVILIELTCSLIYLFIPKFHREDWKGLVSFLNNQTGVAIFESTDSFPPFEYYSSKIDYLGGLKKIPAKNDQDLVDLNPQYERVFYVEYLVDIADPNRLLQKRLKDLGYVSQKIYNFNGVGLVYEYLPDSRLYKE